MTQKTQINYVVVGIEVFLVQRKKPSRKKEMRATDDQNYKAKLRLKGVSEKKGWNKEKQQ